MNSEKPAFESGLTAWATNGNRPALLMIAVAVVAIIAILVSNNLPRQEMGCLFENYQPTFAEQNRILTALGSTELKDYRVEDGHIVVPLDQKGKFLAAISDKAAMPDVLVKEPEFQPNLFLPRSQLRLQQLAQKKKQVCEMIKRLPFVSDARFEFDREESRELFQPHQQTAVVMVTPHEGSLLNRQQLQSIQRTVASAIAGIKPHEVAVIDSNAGIAYDDIRELEQTQLIELVNWKMQRREHFERLLHTSLSPDFPGIEVAVQIQAVIREANQRRERPSSVFKLASTDQEEPAIQTSGIGLNTTTTVSVDSIPVAPELVDDPDVVPASFEATLPHATTEVVSDRPERFEPYSEKLSVKIIVPNGLLNTKLANSDPTQTTAQRFQELSDQIAAQVRANLPEELLAGSMPIEIVPRCPLSRDNQGIVGSSKMTSIQNLWPLWTMLLLGVFAAIAIRNHNRAEKLNSHSNEGENAEDSDLEKQLSDLIERDPAMAAKVLKNWIQQEQ